MQTDYFGAVVLGLIAALPIVMLIVTTRRARRRVDTWAQSSDVRLVRCSLRTVFRGPFTWKTSKAQFVFRITAAKEGGARRHGFVRVGGHFDGLASKEVAVRWDDQD